MTAGQSQQKEYRMLPFNVPWIVGVIVVICVLPATGNVLFGADEDTLYNITLGTLEPDAAEIGGGFYTSLIPHSMSVHDKGVIHQFSVKLGSVPQLSKVYVQVWRENQARAKEFKLMRSKELYPMIPGINTVKVAWYLKKGDYIGVTCDGYCPIIKDFSKTEKHYSYVKMNDRMTGGFFDTMTMYFDDPLLEFRLAVQVEVEVNSLPPLTTEVLPSGGDSQTTTVASTKSAVVTKSETTDKTTVKLQPTNQQAQMTETGSIGVWWVLVGAAVVIVLLCVALVLVAACSWRRERSTLKKQLISKSRPSSTVSDLRRYDERGRPHSTASSSAFDTLARQGQGLQRINEIEVVNDHGTPTSHSVVATVSPSISSTPPPPLPPQHDIHRETTVMFDNGVTNVYTPNFRAPPPLIYQENI